MEQNLFLKYGLRALGYKTYKELADVPEDFLAPNASCMPKPTTEPSTNPDDRIHNIEIEISSDESGDEYESDDSELSF